MKRLSTTLLGVLVSVLVLSISADSSAKDRGKAKGFGFCKGRGMGGAMQFLELSDQQRGAINQLRTEHRELVSQLEDDLDAKRTQMHTLMSAAQLDRQAIESKRNEMEPIRQELRDARHKHRLDMLELLTPQQRTQWHKQRATYPGCRKGHHRGGGKHRARGRCIFGE